MSIQIEICENEKTIYISEEGSSGCKYFFKNLKGISVKDKAANALLLYMYNHYTPAD